MRMFRVGVVELRMSKGWLRGAIEKDHSLRRRGFGEFR